MNLFKMIFVAIIIGCINTSAYANNALTKTQDQNTQQSQMIQQEMTPPASEGPLAADQIQPLLQMNGK